MSAAGRSHGSQPCRRGRRPLPGIALAAAGAVFLLGIAQGCGAPDGEAGGARAERFRPLQVGAAVPAYAVRTLEGDTVRVGPAGAGAADATAGPVLLNVWATWCAPCQREFPELERLHQAHSGAGLRIVAVSIDRGDDEAVEAFAREHGATFTIGRDPTGTVQDRFQTMGVPESYLIGSDGTLLWRHVGELPAEDAELAKALAKAGV